MPLRPDWREYGVTVSKLIARAWADPEFREYFVNDPAAALRLAGLEIPEGVEVSIDQTPGANWRIVPSSSDPQEAIYVIPLPPRPRRLSDAELRTWVEQSSTSSSSRLPIICCY